MDIEALNIIISSKQNDMGTAFDFRTRWRDLIRARCFLFLLVRTGGSEGWEFGRVFLA